MMTEEELKKRCCQYMQAQLEQTFDQDNISLCSSKTSTKTIEETEKSLNQDSDEKIPHDAQDLKLEENIDDYIRQLMEDTVKKKFIRNPSVKNAARLRRITWLQRTNGFTCKRKNRYHKFTCTIPSGSNKHTNDITNTSKDTTDECHDVTRPRQIQNDGSTDVINHQ